jgi:hypothetical protein
MLSRGEVRPEIDTAETGRTQRFQFRGEVLLYDFPVFAVQ